MLRTTALALLLLATPALAETPSPAEVAELCSNMEELATTIMTARQENRSMSQMMVLVEQADPSVKEVVRATIQDAYNQPAYSSDRGKERAISEFGNAVASMCYGAF